MSCEQRTATNSHRHYGRFVPGLDGDGLRGIIAIAIAIAITIIADVTAVVFVSAIAAAVFVAVGLFGRQVRSATTI